MASASPPEDGHVANTGDSEVSQLLYRGSDIGFDPYFDALKDVNVRGESTTRDSSRRVNLDWDNLCFSVPDKKASASRKAAKSDTSTAEPGAAAPSASDHLLDATLHDPDVPRGHKVILKDIRGSVKAGQMLAILGPSGSGKSSLLNLLAGRITANPNAHVTGSVLVNGQPRDYSTFKKIAAYVLQDDDMFGELTVREQIKYAAMLRLPSSISQERKMLRVDNVIQELGLAKVADTLIGNATIRGISGGERKRVSIGTELVTDSSLLFLDEPTSGLDSFNALNVITSLRRLASNGRTVVTTIHQPRSSIFQLFDMLLLLSNGRVMYFGPAREAIPYFSSLRFPSPPSFNPADFFLDLIAVDPRTSDLEKDTVARVDFLGQKFDQSDILPRDHMETAARAVGDVENGGMNGAPTSSPSESTGSKKGPRTAAATVSDFQRSWPNEFRILASRAVRIAMRSQTANFVRGFQTAFFAVVLGLMWLSNGRENNFESQVSLTGLLFFICINQAFIGVFSVIFDYPLERSVVTRERASGSYRSSSYYLSKTITEIPRTVLYNVLFVIIIYWMVGLRNNFGVVLRFFLIVFLVSLYGESLAVTVSILTGDAQASAALAPVLIITAVLFGGFFIPASRIPDWLEWLKWVSFVFYGFNAFAKAQFSGNKIGEEILQDGFNSLSYWANTVCLFAIIVALRIIGYLVLQYLRAPKFLSF